MNCWFRSTFVLLCHHIRWRKCSRCKYAMLSFESCKLDSQTTRRSPMHPYEIHVVFHFKYKHCQTLSWLQLVIIHRTPKCLHFTWCTDYFCTKCRASLQSIKQLYIWNLVFADNIQTRTCLEYWTRFIGTFLGWTADCFTWQIFEAQGLQQLKLFAFGLLVET